MVTQELLDYIKQQKEKGVSNDDLRSALLNNGWEEKDVNAVLGGMIPLASQEQSVPQASSSISREEAALRIKKLGKFKASWRLFVQSFNLLMKDKEIVLFPILSTITLMIAAAIFCAGTVFSGLVVIGEEEAQVTNPAVFYGVVFAYYVIAYFLLTYFRVGLTSVVYERINGGDIGFGEGMSRASKIGGKIFVWSLLAGTVGIILRIISDRSKWLGKLVASLLGAAWGIVTMFIAPTLLLDNVSVWQSVKNSAVVFKKTWGETLILNISFGLITMLILFTNIVLFFILGSFVISSGLGSVGIIILGILFILSIIVISIISTSLTEIFKVALYSYARFGIIAEGFSPEFIVGAVKEGKGN